MAIKRYRNRLKSVFILNEHIFSYYKELANARKNGRLVASLSLGFPSELLQVFDILPMYPQNHAAMYATLGNAKETIDEIESKGYLTDICSEIKISLGTMLHDLQLSFKLPRPDIVMASSNVCRSMAKFGEIISEELELPYFFLDVPIVSDSVPDFYIQHTVEQFKDMIGFLEGVTGKKLDRSKLGEVLELSFQASKLWMEILELSTIKPSPIDALDIYRHMFPLISLRGTQRAVDYYKILRREVFDRVSDGVGAVAEEKYRLMWDYLPIYHKMNFLSRVLSKRGAAIATSTFFYPLPVDSCEICYEEIPIYRRSYDEMLEGLAKDIMQLYPNTSPTLKLQTIKHLAEKYAIDGMIIHCDMSCKPQSLPQYQIKNMTEKELGVPCIIIDADSVDPRFFSEEQVVNRLEAFLERLPEQKEGK